MAVVFKNGKVITEEGIIENGGVVIEKDKIKEIFTDNNHEKYSDYRVVDVQGKYISPGFIDIHTHGGGGHDFMDGTVDAIVQGAKAHMYHGTTSIVPTTLTSTMDTLYNTLDNVKLAKKDAKLCPNILGIHLEGPYFSFEQRGAQDPKYLKNPDKEEYTKILDYCDDIVRWTVAPELPGAMEMGRVLSKRGVVCSMGHSDAISEQVEEAFENGYNLVTHLYSGMSMVKRINAFRYAGMVEGAYLIDEMYVEVIADGMHLPASLLKLIYKVKGPDKICLVTDSMRAAGMPEGEYILGSKDTGQRVIVEDGVAKLIDRTAFAGSVATADRLVRNMVNLVDMPMEEAVKMMTINPAKVMRIYDQKGSIAPEKDADIIVFDENINIDTVMVQGKITVQK
ncbi:N-acetylglucosamine-6-phosphate deacetylase [Clostridiisalibacter paucivorans]|uniref:N-acetylglucosamine-6-phosphate deacetylase n=1 Tax=Clostridiisalibacter paucivorans TaxID=408753 RepID=UPI000A8CEC0B|nr:N-acetylglucosamine-6-phosphate deacetylase [Clostridiisalibacter paucivorans]